MNYFFAIIYWSSNRFMHADTLLYSFSKVSCIYHHFESKKNQPFERWRHKISFSPGMVRKHNYEILITSLYVLHSYILIHSIANALYSRIIFSAASFPSKLAFHFSHRTSNSFDRQYTVQQNQLFRNIISLITKHFNSSPLSISSSIVQYVFCHLKNNNARDTKIYLLQ